MAKVVVTEVEVRTARAFLRTINGNQTNTYLLLAVITWLRAMAKAHDPYWRSLRKYSAATRGTLLARKLVARAKADSKNYKGVLASLRRGAEGDKAQKQAVDFLIALGKSKWDKKHYGYVPHKDAYVKRVWHQTGWGSGYWEDVYVPEQQEENPLAKAWAKLTGHPIPPSWFIDTTKTITTKTVPPRPTQPRSLLHVRPQPDYILPYASYNFYEAKPHYGSMLLPDD